MKKRSFCLLIALMLLPALALAARMPEQRGSLTDDANVLSAQTAGDLATYAERLTEKTDVALHVVIVHFLDGLDAQTYANELFERWKLEEDDLLLLGAAGEDSCAAVMGKDVQKLLGKTNAENLLFTSSEFSTLFAAQQYDAAVAAYCTALTDLAHKQTGETVRMDGLFGQTASNSVQQYGSELWSSVMQSISESSESYREDHEREKREENGLTAGGWIVLIVLIVIMTRQSKAQKAYSRRRRSGCLSWILGLFGVNLLIDLLRGRRH